MFSFWEQNTFGRCNLAVIGGGISGLSVAAAYLEKRPGASVFVFDRGILPTGASTKNAGFACFGSPTELLSDLKTLSEPETVDLVTERRRGLEIFRNRLGDNEIGFKLTGGYELLDAGNEAAAEQIERLNNLLRPVFGETVYEVCDEKIRDFGFAPEKVSRMIKNNFEGQIDTGRALRRLMNYVSRKGGLIFSGTGVTAFEEEAGGVRISVRAGPEKAVFVAGKTAVCTNAFGRDLVPNLDLRPGRGQVLVTEPVPDLPFEGVFHLDEGYYYFRNYGKRVVFGGGRNLDFTGEETEKQGTTKLIMNSLEEKMREVILPGRSFRIASAWSGIMAFGPDKRPVVKMISPRIGIGLRLGGMGVALGSRVGEKLAGLLNVSAAQDLQSPGC